MTGMRLSMSLRLTALAAAILLAGCGEERSEPPAATPTPTATVDPAAGSFPDRPQFVERFGDPGSGWPRAGYREGAFALDDGAALAPQEVRPGTRGTLSEVVLEPPSGGAGGLLCRMSADGGTGYALLLGSDARVRLLRLEDGDATVLKAHRLSPNERADRGKPSLLRLGCGTGAPGEPVTLIYSVNATPYGYVADERAVDPGETARVGLVAEDGVARFDDFALWLGR
jgi:hypothetical protein